MPEATAARSARQLKLDASRRRRRRAPSVGRARTGRSPLAPRFTRRPCGRRCRRSPGTGRSGRVSCVERDGVAAGRRSRRCSSGRSSSVVAVCSSPVGARRDESTPSAGLPSLSLIVPWMQPVVASVAQAAVAAWAAVGASGRDAKIARRPSSSARGGQRSGACRSRGRDAMCRRECSRNLLGDGPVERRLSPRLWLAVVVDSTSLCVDRVSRDMVQTRVEVTIAVCGSWALRGIGAPARGRNDRRAGRVKIDHRCSTANRCSPTRTSSRS